ncbi:MAG: ABC transporter permease subunit [Oscillospiraceae bacterium]|jgi:NitT/TauT family transport system permease protein|nr:ABC transporter permease subunit [Oscillospiraceae bacterium]
MNNSIIKNKTGSDKLRKAVRSLLFAAVWVALWQLAAALFGNGVLLPTPLVVARTLVKLARTAVFWRSAGFSLLRVTAGFFFGVAAGTCLAALGGVCEPAEVFFRPVISLVRATPVASFIVLAVLWVKTDAMPVFISALMVLPVVSDAVSKSINACDPELTQMAKAFSLSRPRLIFRVLIPQILPDFLAACTSGLGFAWKSAVAAEVLVMPRWALGTRLRNARSLIETPELFALTAVVIIFSVIIEKLLIFLLGRVNRR